MGATVTNQITKISDLINPEVMADMISAKIPNKLVVTPFAKVDTTLQGVPGDTITIPRYGYIGDAVDVAEGMSVDTVKLTTSTMQAKVKKAMKAVTLTDEAVLSGYGDPVGEVNNQLAKSLASKADNDAMDALFEAPLTYDASAAISYNSVVDAVDVFNEELNSDKVMFVNPKQVTQLRKDSNFISNDKYPGNVIMTGEIGMIANTHIVPSRKAILNPTDMYTLTASEPSDWSTKYTGYYTKSGDEYTPVAGDSAPEWAADTYYIKTAAGTRYLNPIVKVSQDTETEDELPAVTIYLKRDVNVEAERHTLSRTTDISADKVYTAALTNSSKVVLALFKK